MVDKNNMEDNNIEFTGKIAKFPKNTKAVQALQFLEKIKVNPNKLWYILVESQDTMLKMVKYNRSKGVNLINYTTELKAHYVSVYQYEPTIIESINKITVEGEDGFSIIKNIPQILLDNNQTLISKITSDLIKLLAD